MYKCRFFLTFILFSDRYEPQTYYVDTGFMYIEQDLQTGEVRNVTDAFKDQNQNAVDYPVNKPLAITAGPKAESVIQQNAHEDVPVVRRSVVAPQKEGSVILPRKEGSVIVRKEGSVIMPPNEGPVIIKRPAGSIINGSVVRGPVAGERIINGSMVRGPVAGERIIQRTVTRPPQRIMLPPRESFVASPRFISAPRAQGPQTVRVIRPMSAGPQTNYRYVDNNRQTTHRLYKTTINVASSDTDSSNDGPREVVKTRYMSSPSNQFKNVKGVPTAKMYVPTPNTGPSKNSNDDTDNSSLDSVDIRKFERELIKGRKYNKK